MQAEAVREQTEAINNWIDNSLATKRDIKELEHRMKEQEERLTIRINEMGYKITIRLGSMIVGAVAVVSVLMLIVLRFFNH